MCRATDCGVTKNLSPSVVATFWASRWPFTQYRCMERMVRGWPALAYSSAACSMVKVKSLSPLVAAGRDWSCPVASVSFGISASYQAPDEPNSGYPHACHMDVRGNQDPVSNRCDLGR